jgi:hypothetical protein
MNAISVYTRLYVDSLVKAFQAIRKNLWTLLLPPLLWILLMVAASVAGQFGGPVGGIIFGLVIDAIFSAYLYFVGELVCGSKVSLNELKRSFGAYFWAVLNLLFVLFVARFILGNVLRGPTGTQIYMVTTAVAAIAFNAVPEVLYQRGTHGGLQTLQESWRFLQENWLPWFIPNAPLIVALVALTGTSALLSPITSFAFSIWGLLLGPLAHVAMVFRGFLFAALARSSHRQRMFQYRNAR